MRLRRVMRARRTLLFSQTKLMPTLDRWLPPPILIVKPILSLYPTCAGSRGTQIES